MAMFEASIAKSVDAANNATNLMQVALMEFAAHCAAGKWTEAEESRLRAICHLEAHMDNIATVYKVLLQQR